MIWQSKFLFIFYWTYLERSTLSTKSNNFCKLWNLRKQKLVNFDIRQLYRKKNQNILSSNIKMLIYSFHWQMWQLMTNHKQLAQMFVILLKHFYQIYLMIGNSGFDCTKHTFSLNFILQMNLFWEDNVEI